MRNLRRALLVVGIALMWPAVAFAEVKVNFIDPDHDTDANLRQP